MAAQVSIPERAEEVLIYTKLAPLDSPTQDQVDEAVNKVLAMHPKRGVPAHLLAERTVRELQAWYDLKLRLLATTRTALVRVLVGQRLDAAFERQVKRELAKADPKMRPTITAEWKLRAYDYREWYKCLLLLPEKRMVLIAKIDQAYAENPSLPGWARRIPDMLDEIPLLEATTREQIAQLPALVEPMVPMALVRLRSVLDHDPPQGIVRFRCYA